MTRQAHIDEAIRDAKRQWFELDAEAVGWNLQRQFRVPKHIAAAIVEKFKASEQWSRAQKVMLDSANKRIKWLESNVDPELLNQKRETVSCKPPAEASD